MIDADLGRVPFWRCRNLSLIVPLYGLGEWLLQAECISGFPHLSTHAATNETYSPRERFLSLIADGGATALIKASGARGLSRNGDYA